MEINVSHDAKRADIAVVSIAGQLDGQTYQTLIEKAREAYTAGARNILLDMSDLTYISSAGLVAIHTMSLMLNGDELPDPEKGWSSLKSMDKTRQGGMQKHLKFLNPRPEVTSVLDMVGFSAFFESFDDKQKAIASY
jgi:anti-anti-sigma regulatory factor